ncbi:GNAT family N-acetyltransferase [Ferrimonas sediminicola]|nr:GNAT family N-acetyltransferase [Ferrimonas sediminicola]
MKIRQICTDDNSQLAKIIRDVLAEYGANRPGFAWQDPELDALSQVYVGDGRRYWVAELQGRVVGGVGIAPFDCHWPATCELQKMYLSRDCRGQGIGQTLLETALGYARQQGYRHCYLETFGPMLAARGLYEASGFESLPAPWGDSGHTACDCWMMKAL